MLIRKMKILLIKICLMLFISFPLTLQAKTLLVGSYSYKNLCDILQIKGFIKEVGKNDGTNEVSVYRIIFFSYFANKNVGSLSYVTAHVRKYIHKMKFDRIVLFNDVAFSKLYNINCAAVYATGLNCSTKCYKWRGIDVRNKTYNIKGLVLENIDIHKIIDMLETHPITMKIIVISSPVEVAEISSCMLNQILGCLTEVRKPYKVIDVLTTDHLREKLTPVISSTALVIIALPYLFDVSSGRYFNLAEVAALVDNIVGYNSLVLVPAIHFCKYFSTVDICVSADFEELGKEIADIVMSNINDILTVKIPLNKTAINFRRFSHNLYRRELELEKFDYVYGY